LVRPRKGAKADGGREDGDGDGSGGGRHHVAQPGPHPDLKEKFVIIYMNLNCEVCLTLGFLILLSHFPSYHREPCWERGPSSGGGRMMPEGPSMGSSGRRRWSGSGSSRVGVGHFGLAILLADLFSENYLSNILITLHLRPGFWLPCFKF